LHKEHEVRGRQQKLVVRGARDGTDITGISRGELSISRGETG
jgi:hypothetical protein